MTAKELIEHLQSLIDREGEDVKVYFTASGYYCSSELEEPYAPEIYTLQGTSPKQRVWSIGHSHQSY